LRPHPTFRDLVLGCFGEEVPGYERSRNRRLRPLVRNQREPGAAAPWRRPVLLRSSRLAYHDRDRIALPAPRAGQTQGLRVETDEPATLDAAGVDLGEPSGSRNQQARIPSTPASYTRELVRVGRQLLFGVECRFSIVGCPFFSVGRPRVPTGTELSGRRDRVRRSGRNASSWSDS
jgi:hypothetical protein